MAYMLPLKFIRVSEDMSICATRIIAIMSTHAYQARRLIREEKLADTLLNAAGRGKVKSAVILDNGAVIASPFSIGQLLNNISKADSKRSKGKTIPLSYGLKLYDVIPDEVYNEELEDYPEIEGIEGESQPQELDIDAMGDTDGDEALDDVLDIAWDGEVSEDDTD